jgi:nucleoid DNA-binding protein
MTLTKAQIIESIQNETGFSKNRQLEVVENLKEAIDSTTCLGEDICHLSLGGCVLKKRRNGKKKTSMLAKIRFWHRGR